jgi:hypothetical protein
MKNTNENPPLLTGWVTEAQVAEERGFYSDMFKDDNGVRPHQHTDLELAEWCNMHYYLDGNMIKKVSEHPNHPDYNPEDMFGIDLDPAGGHGIYSHV